MKFRWFQKKFSQINHVWWNHHLIFSNSVCDSLETWETKRRCVRTIYQATRRRKRSGELVLSSIWWSQIHINRTVILSMNHFFGQKRFCKHWLEISQQWFCGRIARNLLGIDHDLIHAKAKSHAKKNGYLFDLLLLLSIRISNGSEEVSKRMKLRYLHPVEVRNHGMFGTDSILFEIFEKALSRWKVL